MYTSQAIARWFPRIVAGVLIMCLGFVAPSNASAAEAGDTELSMRVTSAAVEPAEQEQQALTGGIVPMGPHEGVIRYHCYFAGGSAVEYNIRYCRNASVNIVQNGKTIGHVSTDSSGKPYVGKTPNWYCVAAVGSGIISIFTGAGVKVGWLTAAWLLNTIGLYGSCKKN